MPPGILVMEKPGYCQFADTFYKSVWSFSSFRNESLHTLGMLVSACGDGEKESFPFNGRKPPETGSV